MKIEHIRKRQDFARVLEKGKKVQGGKLCLYILPEEPAQGLSAGVIIPKKLAASAVRRNYVRRLVYAIFREKGGYDSNKGAKVVVRVTKSVGEAKRKDLSKGLRDELNALLLEAGVE